MTMGDTGPGGFVLHYTSSTVYTAVSLGVAAARFSGIPRLLINRTYDMIQQ